MTSDNAATQVRVGDGQPEPWDIVVSPFHAGGNVFNFIFDRLRQRAPVAVEGGEVPRLPQGIARCDEALRIGAQHNLRLATRGYPAQTVAAAGKSFSRAVRDLHACAELTGALARIRRAPG